MAYQKSSFWLLLLLSLLLIIQICMAEDIPTFKFPPNTSQQSIDEMKHALKDAMTLARFVAIASQPCDESFLRYFQPQDNPFVQGVFRTVANIPLDQKFDDSNIEDLLKTMDKDATLNPKFADLSISLGDHPDVREEDRGRSCKDGSLAAQTTYLPSQYGNRALMAICPPSLEFYYSLQDIETPPEWALSTPGGKPETGFGCDGLLDRDTSYMLSPGAVILHELMHWPYLLQDIADYAKLAQPTTGGFSKILDFAGPDPPDGYGPFNSAKVRNLPVNKFTGASQAIRNADSYVWYATDKYWSYGWRCNRAFKASTSPNDNNLRNFIFSDNTNNGGKS